MLRVTSAPLLVVSYESLVHYREAGLKRVRAELGLTPTASEIRDANRKYYHSLPHPSLSKPGGAV